MATPRATPGIVDVVLPCLDEAGALPWVLDRVPAGYRAIVADNGSTDGSGQIALELGALVVPVPQRGFGAAAHAGLEAATADIVCFCDADGSMDPAQLPRIYADLINTAVAERPDDMVVTMHLCRGNFRSSWIAEGGYEPVAELLFNEIAVDGYFLEYDSERAGGFEPLRHVPPGKTVV